MGGGFDLQYLGGDNYRLTFTMLRDCENGKAPFNRVVSVAIFDKETNQLVDKFELFNPVASTINPSKPECVQKVPGCTERAIYTDIISLPLSVYNNMDGYYLSWERCCRNHIIKNIQQPEDAGIAYYLEIPSPALYRNSSPKPAFNPFTVLCQFNFYRLNMAFSDADGDSLSYEVVTPINGTLTKDYPNGDDQSQLNNPGPYSKITWMQGYSEQAPINGSPALGVDAQSGELTAYPNEEGVFVFAMRINEYRNGKLIGTTYWELQYTVIKCIGNDPPKIELFQENIKMTGGNIYVRVPDKVTFSIRVKDEEKLDTVELYSGFSKDSTSPFYLQPTYQKDSISAIYSWTWQTNCNHNYAAKRQIKIIARDNGCPIPKSSQFIFNVNVLNMPVYPSGDVLCLELKENKSTTIYFGDSSRSPINFNSFVLFRSINNQPFVAIDSTDNYKAKSFNDNNTPNYATINYRYFLRTKNNCGELGPSSDTLGTFDQLKALPDKQYIFKATVNDADEVEITWNKTPEKDFARYFLHKGSRSTKDSAFVTEIDFNNEKDTFYIDKKVDVNKQSYCYYVVMLDTCGNYGPFGERFCTIHLSGKTRPFENYLTWENLLFKDDNTPKYQLVRKDDDIPEFRETGLYNYNMLNAGDVKLNPDFGLYTYRANAIYRPYKHPGIIEVSRSNKVELIQDPIIYVPNAFTPNDDNLNDSWLVNDVFVKNFHARVYNAWGQLVFETTDKNNKWNAMDFSGNPVPLGVYVYHITYDGWDTATKTSIGNVTILK